jgi:aminoglycoside 6'-N-acetyltransferase I
MNTTRIRNTVLGDIAELTQLFVACFNAPPWNDGWSEAAARERLGDLLSAKQARGAVALDGIQPVGMILGQRERWVDAHHFNIVEMCVLPAQQRQGIGEALLAHLTQQLELEGVTKLYLITAPETDAARFYAKQGFRSTRGRVFLTRAVQE